MQRQNQTQHLVLVHDADAEGHKGVQVALGPHFAQLVQEVHGRRLLVVHLLHHVIALPTSKGKASDSQATARPQPSDSQVCPTALLLTGAHQCLHERAWQQPVKAACQTCGES